MATTTRPTFTLGDRLRKAREHAGLTQSEMRIAVGAHPSTQSRWESDKTTPSALQMRAWADTTGVDLEWLDPDHDIRSRCSDRGAA